MNVLVLSPHTDDGELGAGATINRLLREGHHIQWVVFSTCEESLPKGQENLLKEEFIKSMKILGIEDYFIENYKVRRIHEKRQDVLELLIKIRKKFQPNLVIGQSTKDWHQDHQVINNEMIRAFKTTSSIIGYELPWNHVEFETKMFFKLKEEDLTAKIKALKEYQSQVEKKRIYFKEAYIKGLATVRGTQCNEHYAEAFEVIKWIH